MYNFQITALCISFLYACCGKITFLRQSQPHRACLPPDNAAYIFSIHLGFHCGEYNTQRDTVYHIWSVCPSCFQLTVLFISFAGTGFMERCRGAGEHSWALQSSLPVPILHLLTTFLGRKPHTASLGQCGCRKEVNFWSSDPMRCSGFLAP